MIDLVDVAAEEFIRNTSALTDDQIRAPSLLPGWSRAHADIEGMPRLEPWSNRSKWEFLSSDL